jgi:aminoglycoside phosphotransferase (APT) family kinase protein
MNSPNIPGIDSSAFEQLLIQVTGQPLRLIAAEAIGESSRATPWRIDVDMGGEPGAYLLRYGDSVSPNEVVALNAMSHHPIPTPRVLYWDESGEVLGTPVFVSELIEGAPLLPAMTAGEDWAVDLYIDTASALQAIRAEDLPIGTAELLGAGESVRDVIDAAHRRFPDRERLHEEAYRKLIARQPRLPETAFSNGDLWPENLLVRDRRLVGVIDWQHAGWSDPLFEFLLPFFLVPELRGRGIEERYCQRKGFDPALLDWYHGVEYFDSLSFVLETGKPYEMHTAESLSRDLERWLEAG